MPDDKKRRKRDDGDPVPWTKAKAALFVKEAEELQGALKSCNGSRLAEKLSEALEHVSPEALDILKELVSPFLLDGHHQHRHCVRCHNIYTEKNNHNEACVVFCSRNLHPFSLRGKPKGDYFVTGCCGRVYKSLEGWSCSRLVCYRARHTTDSDEVVYFDPDSQENQEDIEVDDNDGEEEERPRNALPWKANTVAGVSTCERKGCENRRRLMEE